MTVPAFYAHETATIDDGCAIGEGTKIWHYSHIMPGCTIGQKFNIGQNVKFRYTIIEMQSKNSE